MLVFGADVFDALCIVCEPLGGAESALRGMARVLFGARIVLRPSG